MHESEVSQDLFWVDIRFEKKYPFTIQTMNAEGWTYFRDLALVGLAVSGLTMFVVKGMFDMQTSESLVYALLTALVACVVNVALFLPRRVAEGKRCAHCRSRMPEIYTADYCDHCETKYGFSEAEGKARDVIEANLLKWYSRRT